MLIHKMRRINTIRKTGSKKAISEIVAYVMLITIAITLSTLVYSWMKFYVEPSKETVECDDGTRLVIDNYQCYEEEEEKKINITIKNRGLFNVDGFVLRVNDREGSTIGLHVLDDNELEEELVPGEEFNHVYSFTDVDVSGDLEQITLIDVQPFLVNGERVYCEDVSSQTVSDCFS